MRIDGHTELLAHLGYPTHSFKAPLTYNPYFEAAGINAVVVPMACEQEPFAGVLESFFALRNARGALITMPHRGWRSKARAASSSGGGVGRAIAASLADEGVSDIALHDTNVPAVADLAQRLRQHYPGLTVSAGGSDPDGFDLVVNATPLGMQEGDPLPVDPQRLQRGTFVGDVVMRTAMTPFLRAAQDRGCRVQVGTDMLFEMIPAYLEFFGLPVATPDRLRALARLGQ